MQDGANRGQLDEENGDIELFSCFFCLCVLSFFLIVKTATNKQTKGTFLFPSSDEGGVKREQENNNAIDMSISIFSYAIL